MRPLPTDAIAAAQLIVSRMYRPITLSDGANFCAFSENPSTNDLWYWNDDNAKILELLSRPEVWRRFPQETAETLRFVQAMCRGPFVFRRASGPRLETTTDTGSSARYCHSLMWINHNLPAGIVGAALRFHDERNADHLVFGGHYIEFTYRRSRSRLLVAPAIEQIEAKQDGHTLVLRHSGDRYFRPSRNRTRLRIGRITYEYLSMPARW